ncbi:hypothetical protein EP073_07470 [Geovibrio thiophilus]|uniref:Uncharacterized protein n=1 Tax=Geovibrio thiophilus TaxID=139438 RepID=A0A3R5XWZ0_9BACT|nr:hypothetical protein [Geovibrio thiophilus]QAR33245.1 hypothetical protein EP073_07470 [Geovibrio thiophilus]
MDPKTAKEDIERLEKLIIKMKFEYEQYIRGNLKLPPSSVEREINNIVQNYNRKPLTNTSLRFKFNNLTARFLSIRQKIQRDMGIRDGFIKNPYAEAHQDEEAPQDEKLFSKLNELPANYDKQKVIAVLNAKINELKSQGYADIDVSLEIENGKPRLRIITKDEKKTLQN